MQLLMALIGPIVWAIRRLTKPRSREMSARGYALHSVCFPSSFLPLSTPRRAMITGNVVRPVVCTSDLSVLNDLPVLSITTMYMMVISGTGSRLGE